MSRKNSKRRERRDYSNRNAIVASKPNEGAAFGGLTETSRRDDGFFAFVSTSSSNSTDMSVCTSTGAPIYLTGREARTLQRLLNKHFSSLGRSRSLPGA